jgi:hypothetical protein
MKGETDLKTLLQTMQPWLDPRPLDFCSVESAAYPRLGITPLDLFHEAERVTCLRSRYVGYRPALTPVNPVRARKSTAPSPTSVSPPAIGGDTPPPSLLKRFLRVRAFR